MYFKDLTEKEKKHLQEMDITTLTEFKLVAQTQKEMRDSQSMGSEPCWDCRAIAKKLGLPV